MKIMKPIAYIIFMLQYLPSAQNDIEQPPRGKTLFQKLLHFFFSVGTSSENLNHSSLLPYSAVKKNLKGKIKSGEKEKIKKKLKTNFNDSVDESQESDDERSEKSETGSDNKRSPRKKRRTSDEKSSESSNDRDDKSVKKRDHKRNKSVKERDHKKDELLGDLKEDLQGILKETAKKEFKKLKKDISKKGKHEKMGRGRHEEDDDNLVLVSPTGTEHLFENDSENKEKDELLFQLFVTKMLEKGYSLAEIEQIVDNQLFKEQMENAKEEKCDSEDDCHIPSKTKTPKVERIRSYTKKGKELHSNPNVYFVDTKTGEKIKALGGFSHDNADPNYIGAIDKIKGPNKKSKIAESAVISMPEIEAMADQGGYILRTYTAPNDDSNLKVTELQIGYNSPGEDYFDTNKQHPNLNTVNFNNRGMLNNSANQMSHPNFNSSMSFNENPNNQSMNPNGPMNPMGHNTTDDNQFMNPGSFNSGHAFSNEFTHNNRGFDRNKDSSALEHLDHPEGESEYDPRNEKMDKSTSEDSVSSSLLEISDEEKSESKDDDSSQQINDKSQKHRKKKRNKVKKNNYNVPSDVDLFKDDVNDDYHAARQGQNKMYSHFKENLDNMDAGHRSYNKMLGDLSKAYKRSSIRDSQHLHSLLQSKYKDQSTTNSMVGNQLLEDLARGNVLTAKKAIGPLGPSMRVYDKLKEMKKK